ncbi:PA14 domain-containing protein [Streptomyces sp. NPDC001978]|uniref:PA14 domain-containing protein n=1 Tax=Streptomyces sp. NPDC001978 TaxID=3364627 RepID=UPI003693EFD3
MHTFIRDCRAIARVTTLVLAVATAGLVLPAATAQAVTTCAAGVWKASYYANTTFSATPKLTVCDTAINENYGTGDPAGVTLPRDNFSVRWTMTRNYGSGGPFTFTTAAQDGIRVYLDGVRKIDLWKNYSSTQTKAVNVAVPQGSHTIRVDFAAFTGSANVKFTHAPRTSAAVDKVKPLAPTGLKAVYTSTRETGLTWTKNAEADLAGYRVYRRTGTSATWTYISGSSGLFTGTHYTDTPPPTGDAYGYAIVAVDKAGNASARSAEARITSADKTAPAAPAVTATGTTLNNIINWPAVPDAVTYAVYRGNSSTGTFSKLADTTSTSYTDGTAAYGTWYWYKVRAFDKAGNSALSVAMEAARSIWVPKLTATAQDYGIRLQWSEPEGSDTSEYVVFRSETSPVENSPNDLFLQCRDWKSTPDGSGNTTTTCIDYSAKRAVTYHYAIMRRDTATNRWSVLSNEASATRDGDEVPPPPLTGLTAEALEYGIRLDWEDSTASDLAEYWIYSGWVSESGSCQNCEFIASVDAATTEYLVGPILPDGQTNHYMVVAVDKYGNSLTYEDEEGGEFSPSIASVAVTELDLTPTVIPEQTAYWDLYSWADDAGQVHMSWYCGAASCPAVSGFNVYRWDRTAGEYVKLTAQPLAAEARGYADPSAPTGTANYYLLKAVYADGSEAACNVDWAVSLPSAQ